MTRTVGSSSPKKAGTPAAANCRPRNGRDGPLYCPVIFSHKHLLHTDELLASDQVFSLCSHRVSVILGRYEYIIGRYTLIVLLVVFQILRSWVRIQSCTNIIIDILINCCSTAIQTYESKGELPCTRPIWLLGYTKNINTA